MNTEYGKPDHQTAYPVPFRVLRNLPTLWLVNIGAERLRALRFQPLSDGIVSPSYIPKIDVDERVNVSIYAQNPELNLVIQVSWLRPDGREFLWRVSF